MRLLRFDSVGGASGDMILAALLDLGVDHSALVTQLRQMNVEAFDVEAEAVTAGGMRGTRVSVHIPDHHDGHGHHHPHRRLKDIRQLVETGSLPRPIQTLSLEVFQRLAEAEAAVHGVDKEEIHFHEVGALDSIVDIVGACAALTMLDIDAVEVGPLPLGRGTTTCAHGVLPVPVPATVELLKGWPVVQTEETCELVTPTGAALLTTWARRLACQAPAGDAPALILVRKGHGCGHRQLQTRPNVLRAMLMESAPGPATALDECLVLECNVDDTVPELMGTLAQRLMEQGALDVFTTPVQMKKQRQGLLLTVLCRPEQKDRFVDLIFAESTTFGIRSHMTQRFVLARRLEEADTPYGSVKVKIGSWRGRDITRAPEHEDCVKCAKAKGVPVRVVYESACRQAGPPCAPPPANGLPR